MKKIKSVLILLCCCFTLTAQENLSDFDRISIAPFISDQVEHLPSGARSGLENKLGQMITANGFGASLYNARFVLTPNIEVVEKHILPTAPPTVAVHLNVHLFIGDGIEGTKYGGTVVQVKGVGNNENKAYIDALGQLNSSSAPVQRLIANAKGKILDFYNSRCDFILKEAEIAATVKDYDRALFVLSSIPQVNMECFEKATALIGPVYDEKINRDCLKQLSLARNIWNSGQDYEAALNASKVLSRIEPSSECFNDVRTLSNEIGRRMKEVDSREWNFQLREQDLEVRKIEAARAVGVAYGNNQPQNVTYNLRGWW